MEAEDILGADDLTKELVFVPEWNKSIWIRALTVEELDSYDTDLISEEKAGNHQLRNSRAKLVVRAACNEDGSRIFLDDQASALGRKNGAAVAKLFDVANRLCGRSPDAQEELEKNSASGQADGSRSA